MAFESYEKTPAELGSFLSSRYKNSSVQHMSISYAGNTGSVAVLIER